MRYSASAATTGSPPLPIILYLLYYIILYYIILYYISFGTSGATTGSPPLPIILYLLYYIILYYIILYYIILYIIRYSPSATTTGSPPLPVMQARTVLHSARFCAAHTAASDFAPHAPPMPRTSLPPARRAYAPCVRVCKCVNVRMYEYVNV